MGQLPAFIEPSLKLMQARLRARFGERLRFVRLFGSHARGDATAQSDIDVAVVVDDLTHPERMDAVAIIHEVELETDHFVSSLVMPTDRFAELSRAGRALALDIEREGLSA
jgi:predicted nucleotidyltransferase